MKRILSIAFIVSALLFSAMSAKAQFRYGPTIGIAMTDLNFKQDLFTVDKCVGYSFGVAAEMMFPGIGFGIDFGLFYEQRGAKLHMGERKMWASQGIGTEQLRLHTIVLPVHLRFKYTRLNGVEDKIAPLAYVGPSLGFLAGHSKMGHALNYAGADLGIDFGIGAEIFKKWQVSVSYTMGMTYATKAKVLTNFSARNALWALRATYLF